MADENVIEVVLKSVDQMSADLKKVEDLLGDVSKSAGGTKTQLDKNTQSTIQLASATDSAQKSLDGLNTVLTGLGVNFAALATVASRALTAINLVGRGLPIAGIGVAIGAMGALANKTAALGEELIKLSGTTGLSVEKLAALKVAAEQNNTSLDAAAFALRFFNRNLGEAARHATPAQDALIRLGYSIEQIRQAAKDPEGFLESFARRFSSIKDVSEKNSVAFRLFRFSGTELYQLLNDLGKNGFAGLEARAKGLGLAMTTAQAATGKTFRDNLKELGQVLGSIGQTIGQVVIPPLTQLVKLLDMVINPFKHLLAERAPSEGKTLIMERWLGTALGIQPEEIAKKSERDLTLLASKLGANRVAVTALVSEYIRGRNLKLKELTGGGSEGKGGTSDESFIPGDTAQVRQFKESIRIAQLALVAEEARAKATQVAASAGGKPTFTTADEFLTAAAAARAAERKKTIVEIEAASAKELEAMVAEMGVSRQADAEALVSQKKRQSIAAIDFKLSQQRLQDELRAQELSKAVMQDRARAMAEAMEKVKGAIEAEGIDETLEEIDTKFAMAEAAGIHMFNELQDKFKTEALINDLQRYADVLDDLVPEQERLTNAIASGWIAGTEELRTRAANDAADIARTFVDRLIAGMEQGEFSLRDTLRGIGRTLVMDFLQEIITAKLKEPLFEMMREGIAGREGQPRTVGGLIARDPLGFFKKVGGFISGKTAETSADIARQGKENKLNETTDETTQTVDEFGNVVDKSAVGLQGFNIGLGAVLDTIATKTGGGGGVLGVLGVIQSVLTIAGGVGGMLGSGGPSGGMPDFISGTGTIPVPGAHGLIVHHLPMDAIRHFRAGGVVRGPTLGLIGEEGDEIVARMKPASGLQEHPEPIQQTIYVVDERPKSIGPNDVVAIIGDRLDRGGPLRDKVQNIIRRTPN